jgi:hypothetical protein
MRGTLEVWPAKAIKSGASTRRKGSLLSKHFCQKNEGVSVLLAAFPIWSCTSLGTCLTAMELSNWPTKILYTEKKRKKENNRVFSSTTTLSHLIEII